MLNALRDIQGHFSVSAVQDTQGMDFNAQFWLKEVGSQLNGSRPYWVSEMMSEDPSEMNNKIRLVLSLLCMSENIYE
jgi:hypothetical protein